MTRKFFSLLLVLGLLISLSVPVFASEVSENSGDEIVLIKEENGVRTVVAKDDKNEYTVIYDLNHETITFTERSLLTDTESSATVSVADVREQYSVERAVTISQDTDSGFLYRKTTGSPNQWRLTRPKLKDEGTGRFYFMCNENSSNKSYLSAFMSAVNTLANNEATLESKAGSAKFASFITGVLAGFAIGTGGTLAPAAISALLVTAGLTGDAKAAAEVVANQCNVCMSAYFDVFNNTDNIYY